MTKRMRAALLAVVSLGLAITAGCAHAERAVGPDGQADWWNITCRGGDDECHRKAREVCPHDFRMANSDTNHGVPESDCSTTPGSLNMPGTSSCESSMLIKCLP